MADYLASKFPPVLGRTMADYLASKFPPTGCGNAQYISGFNLLSARPFQKSRFFANTIPDN